MTEAFTNAMRSGRKTSGFSQESAAHLLGTDTRNLYRYENPDDVPKHINPNIVLNAMKLYQDYAIGLAYLEMDPVFLELFGGVIQRYDVARSVMRFECENEDDRHVLPAIRRWALQEDQDLPEEYITEIRETLHAALMFFINIRCPLRQCT